MSGSECLLLCLREPGEPSSESFLYPVSSGNRYDLQRTHQQLMRTMQGTQTERLL